MATFGDYANFRLSDETLDFQHTLLDSLYLKPKPKQAHKSPDEVFAELDVEPGDRIRLTRGTQSGALKTASLEGVVKAIKQHGGSYKVQIEGFDFAGNNIFWPVRNYTVTVVQRGFRWTDDDRLLVAVIGTTEKSWVERTEASRALTRDTFAVRIAAVKKAVAEADSGK